VANTASSFKVIPGGVLLNWDSNTQNYILSVQRNEEMILHNYLGTVFF